MIDWNFDLDYANEYGAFAKKTGQNTVKSMRASSLPRNFKNHKHKILRGLVLKRSWHLKYIFTDYAKPVNWPTDDEV